MGRVVRDTITTWRSQGLTSALYLLLPVVGSPIMPQYHLIYFNLRARGELTRWLLQYGGVTYTEERIEFADWPARKPSTPTGKLPILMVDDEPLTQSIAIARYVAQEVGLVPEDNLQAAFANSL